MTNLQRPQLDSDTERRLNAHCLVVEMAGPTWHVPFDALPVVPRVGETIRLARGGVGNVAQNPTAP